MPLRIEMHLEGVDTATFNRGSHDRCLPRVRSWRFLGFRRSFEDGCGRGVSCGFITGSLPKDNLADGKVGCFPGWGDKRKSELVFFSGFPVFPILTQVLSPNETDDFTSLLVANRESGPPLLPMNSNFSSGTPRSQGHPIPCGVVDVGFRYLFLDFFRVSETRNPFATLVFPFPKDSDGGARNTRSRKSPSDGMGTRGPDARANLSREAGTDSPTDG